MDIIDRIELAVRYWFMASLCLLGQTETKVFQKQLRKVTDILFIDESSESVRSNESSSCEMVSRTFEDIGDNELESHRAGEILSENESRTNNE